MTDRSIPPFPRQATCEGHLAADLAVVWRHGESGRLWTSLFYETGGVDEPVRFLREVDWELVPPADAPPWIAAAPRSIGELQTTWVGWRDDEGGLTAESLLREEPCRLELQPSDRLLAPPWMDFSGKLHQLAWREGGDGWTLLDHVAHSDPDTPPTVEVETRTKTQGEPLLGQVLVVPDASEVVTGWIEARKERLWVRLAEVGNEVEPVSIRVRGRLELRQRPALHREPSGNLRFACVLNEASEKGGEDRLRLVEVEVRAEEDLPEDAGRVRVGSAQLSVDPEDVTAAAAFFVGQQEPRLWLLILTSEGDLLGGSGRPPRLERLRTGLEPSYEFPFFATAYSLYQVDFDADGRPRIHPFP